MHSSFILGGQKWIYIIHVCMGGFQHFCGFEEDTTHSKSNMQRSDVSKDWGLQSNR